MASKLSFRSESEGAEFEFFVGFEASDFIAESSAWFSLSGLKSFVEKLAEYPLRDDSFPELHGGIWNSSGTHVVKSLIEISVRPSGNKGKIVVFVRLTVLDDDNQDVKSSAHTSIDASYEEINKMRAALIESIGPAGGQNFVLFQDYA